jgi:predicted DNA-binding transcriptional regulator AlpA
VLQHSTTVRRHVVADDVGYMSAGQVQAYFGNVSAMWLVRRMRDSDFPKPIKFAPRSTAPRFWRRSDIQAWAAAREARSWATPSGQASEQQQ